MTIMKYPRKIYGILALVLIAVPLTAFAGSH